MFGIDSNIYSQIKPLDLLGSVQGGMDVRYKMDQRKNAEQDRLNQEAVKKAYQAGMVQNPDGTVTYDPKKAMGALGVLTNNPDAGKAMYDLNNAQTSKDFEQRKYQDSLKQQDIENQLKRQQIQSAAADRAEARAERRFNTGMLRDDKMSALQTPFGLANTPDDSKQLKEAYESKKNFDNKIDQMIDLRKQYGGEVMNRDAVQRGKQLSKDLLLEYKNMAKLGVLSKSDEDIINAIIPEDPLAFTSPLAAVQGQDPIMNRLQSFKSDSDKDFSTRVSTRTRSGLNQLKQPPGASPTGKPGWAL